MEIKRSGSQPFRQRTADWFTAQLATAWQAWDPPPLKLWRGKRVTRRSQEVGGPAFAILLHSVTARQEATARQACDENNDKICRNYFRVAAF